jgi:hypothetical protein
MRAPATLSLVCPAYFNHSRAAAISLAFSPAHGTPPAPATARSDVVAESKVYAQIMKKSGPLVEGAAGEELSAKALAGASKRELKAVHERQPNHAAPYSLRNPRSSGQLGQPGGRYGSARGAGERR